MIRKDVLKLLAYAAVLAIVILPRVPTLAQNTPKDTGKQQDLDRALIRAVHNRSARAVRDLLNRGANANARDLDAKPDRHGSVDPPFIKEKPTALLIVFDDAQILTGKREKGASQQKLRPDPAEIVKALLDKGADPNVIDYDETFPLLQAVNFKYTTSVRLLLQHHANPNHAWVHGITPLHRAVDNKDLPILKALLAAGADPKARCAFDDPAHPLSEQVANLLKAAP